MSMISEVPWWRFTPRRCYVRAATTEKTPFRERDKGAYLWLQSREGGLKYKTPVTSKVVSGETVEKPYLGGRQTPFPKNPAFKAVAPVSDAVRERLYAQHCANPELETPRKLANQYHLDIRRVEAILRMKHEETKLKATVHSLYGYAPNTDFTTKMEKMLGVSQEAVHAMQQTYHADDALLKRKGAGATQQSKGRPLFTVLQEEEQLPSTEAARLMEATARSKRVQIHSHTKQPANVSTTLPRLPPKVFSLEEDQSRTRIPEWIEQCDEELVKSLERDSKWMIVDTSYTEDAKAIAEKVKVRYYSGGLRLASIAEQEANMPWIVKQEGVKMSRGGREKVLPIFRDRNTE